jgi:Ca2+-transporting ATPase
VAFGLRPRLLTRENLFLPLAVAGSLLLALAGIYLPALQDLLGTVALPAVDVALALGTLLIGWLAAKVTVRLADRGRAR